MVNPPRIGPPPRISMVTLGVADVTAATKFYERLGWQRSSVSQDTVTFFKMQGAVLGLYGRAALAEDAEVDPSGDGFRATTLALNCDDRAEADGVYEAFVSAGATEVKPMQEVFWGGYSGYVADPDGHLWEICHNPFSPNDDDGRMTLP